MPVSGLLKTFLIQHGESVTKARLKVFMMMVEPVSMETLVREVPPTTAYRTVKLFLELGVVYESRAGIYELTDKFAPHRHYKTCTRCGRRTAFNNQALERAVERLDRPDNSLGFKIEGHTLEFTGICGLCRSPEAAGFSQAYPHVRK